MGVGRQPEPRSSWKQTDGEGAPCSVQLGSTRHQAPMIGPRESQRLRGLPGGDPSSSLMGSRWVPRSSLSKGKLRLRERKKREKKEYL